MLDKRNQKSSHGGAVTYGHNVLYSIVTLAAKEIRGVSSLYGRGIKLTIKGNSIYVDVFLNIEFRHPVSEVAFKVQENIKRSIETSTAFKITKINVNVLGVDFSPKE